MWTAENRGRYDRSRLRYPSDLTDEEWALIVHRIPPAKRGGNKRTVNLREIANGLMYILSTGCQWRAIPKDLPPRSTVYDDFDLWSWDGTLDRIHHALYQAAEKARDWWRLGVIAVLLIAWMPDVTALRRCFYPRRVGLDGVRASRRRSEQLGQPDQVVGGHGEGELPVDLGQSAMARLAQPGHRFGPAERLLDALADAQADRVAGMAGGRWPSAGRCRSAPRAG